MTTATNKIVLATESGRPTERLTHHRRERLAKAVNFGQLLVTSAANDSSRVSAHTRAECEAYVAALRGALGSAQMQWAESARAYARARNIHAKLRALPGGRSDAALAIDAALATQLDYAVHRLQRSGGGAAAAAAASSGGSAGDDAEVDALLESARVAASEQQQAAATALRYKGEPLMLESERVLDALRAALDAESHAMQATKAASVASTSTAAQSDAALAAATAADEALVAAHTALMNVTREELRRIIGNVSKQAQIEQLALLRRAIGERIQRRTVARLALQYDTAVKVESRVRTVAPLCASATASAVELGTLAGADAAPAAGDESKYDRRAIALAKATATQWRAARAHALARMRQRAGDFPAAGALLERAVSLIADARRELNSALAIAPPAWADADERVAPSFESGLANAARIDRLQIDVVSVHGAVKAQAFVSTGGAAVSGSDDIVSADSSFESGVARAKAGNLASLRGPVTAIPVKPIMFELAGAGIQFDSLAARTRKQGTSGWLGSLFGR